mmetsp:Transcript_42035/g.101291  ORF Transcript_42035/g.101291 Transcript_42035/m.101291 type:complete len:90 (-) Transcript_42035:198-467(-)
MSLMLKTIYELTLQSSDKLYVIAHADDESGWKTWYESGWKTKPTDARKKPVTQRPFWPFIKEYKDEATYGPTVPIRPAYGNESNRQPHQ